MKLSTVLTLLTMTLAGSASAADFLPLETGNRWAYADAVTGQTFEVRVGSPLFADEHVYYSLHGFTPAPLWVRVNEYDNLVYLDEERGFDSLLTGFRPSQIMYDVQGRECPAWGQTQEKRGTHDGPAGRWSTQEVIYQPYVCADAGDLLEQFVENIGMVRRVVNTIAGPRTFDLVYARVGKLVISAGDTGLFSVTVLPQSADGTWTATLRAEQSSGEGLKLRFPSAQEYDVRLRDQDGNVLWTWSADKLFIQVEHELPSVSNWTATVTVPQPPAIPEGGQVYVLEAWLTSSSDGPVFAAATTILVPPTPASTMLRPDWRRR